MFAFPSKIVEHGIQLLVSGDGDCFSAASNLQLAQVTSSWMLRTNPDLDCRRGRHHQQAGSAGRRLRPEGGRLCGELAAAQAKGLTQDGCAPCRRSKPVWVTKAISRNPFLGVGRQTGHRVAHLDDPKLSRSCSRWSAAPGRPGAGSRCQSATTARPGAWPPLPHLFSRSVGSIVSAGQRARAAGAVVRFRT